MPRTTAAARRIILAALAIGGWLACGGDPAAAACPGPQAAAWPADRWETAPPADPAAVAAFEAVAFPPGQD